MHLCFHVFVPCLVPRLLAELVLKVNCHADMQMEEDEEQ